MRMTIPAANSRFQLSHSQIPVVAELNGIVLKRMHLHLNERKVSALTEMGMSASVRQRHRNVLKLLQELDRDLEAISLPQALVEYHMRLKQHRTWSWATTHRNMASAAGALMALPVYSDIPYGINLGMSPIWKQAMRGAEIKSKESITNAPAPASFTQVQKAIDKAYTSSKPIAMAILLAWIAAARVGCIHQLKREDFEWQGANNLAITFRRGKSVRLRGPYTVHTTVEKYRAELQDFLRNIEPKEFIFPSISAVARTAMGVAVKDALRLVDKKLEQRSLRRGSLQHLASQGADEELLMRFSGHQRVATLRRYLGWGKVERVGAIQMHQVALKLFSPPPPQ